MAAPSEDAEGQTAAQQQSTSTSLVTARQEEGHTTMTAIPIHVGDVPTSDGKDDVNAEVEEEDPQPRDSSPPHHAAASNTSTPRVPV